MQSNLDRLPVRLSAVDAANLQNQFGSNPLLLNATILANIAAQVRSSVTVTGTTTRPSDTSAYASGDLVANSTTAGAVVPISLKIARNSATQALVRRARLFKSGNVLTAASFRVHLYATSPTVTNGDNGAWLSTASGYLGAFDVTIDRAFSDGAAGFGVPIVGTEIALSNDSDGTVFALIEARGTYGPASGEVFTLSLDVNQS